MTPSELAARIDSTNLEPNATADEIRSLCDEANQYQFAAVCVRAYWARLAANRLGVNSLVRVCGLVGYPDGTQAASVRGLEARLAVGDGATEVDIIANLAALVSGDLKALGDDLAYVVKQARQAADNGVLVKVVLPAGLNDEQAAQVAKAAAQAGADYLVANPSGAPMPSAEQIKLLRQSAAGLKLKANGASNVSAALALLNAGVYRLGTTAGAAIVDEARGMVAP